MRTKEISYSKYYAKTLHYLTKDNQWKKGVYKYRGQLLPKNHILPLENDENTLEHRVASLYNFVGLDCKKCLGDRLSELHQYAHHLTSSQQLCMKFFSELIDDNRLATEAMVEFIKKAFGFNIHVGAKCEFEYQEKKEPYLFDVDKDGKVIKGGYEGTSFDFHIQDEEIEIYFEIKFTEDGFKKEKRFNKDRKTKKEIEDKRHMAKARRYLAENVAPEFFREIIKEPEEFLNQYQIYRNIIRITNRNKYVVFISDKNNPLTRQDAESIESMHFHDNVIFTTWQQLIPIYPFELPIQLKAIQDYEE